MGVYESRIWTPSRVTTSSTSNRSGGTYFVYMPDPMSAYPSDFSGELMDHLSDTSVYLAKVDTECGYSGISGLKQLLSRVESLASSLIEGHYVYPQNLIESEVLGSDDIDVVATLRNVAIMDTAMSEMAESEHITHEHLIELQHILLPEMQRGYRDEQNWIGSNYSPVGADHVPPPPEDVPRLMDDLLRFVNGTRGNALANAALAHAQFESIHPFVDGNGRTGRALIHVMLHRAGIAENTILPISVILSRTKRNYINGLHSVRTKGKPNTAHIEDWIESFAHAADDSATKTLRLIDQIKDLHEQWNCRISSQRSASGKRALRSDSVVNKIVCDLVGNPCLTPEGVAQRFGVSRTAATTALTELHEVGILAHDRHHSTRSSYYTALEVSNLIAQLQRVTRSSTEELQAPALLVKDSRPKTPQSKQDFCDRNMPIAKKTCRRLRGHNGQCRS